MKVKPEFKPIIDFPTFRGQADTFSLPTTLKNGRHGLLAQTLLEIKQKK